MGNNVGMKRGQVLVVIAGSSGSGKSAIARIITDALTNSNVVFKYDDSDDFYRQEREHVNATRSLDEAMLIAEKHVGVTVQERNLCRDGKTINYNS
jgi:uridine kinase